MTRAQALLLTKVDNIEDGYKAIFHTMDHVLTDIKADPDKSQVLSMEWAMQPGVRWADPVTYARVYEVSEVIQNMVLFSTYVALGHTLHVYLKEMCSRLFTVQPMDDTWFSFEHLEGLSGVAPIAAVSRYLVIHKLSTLYERFFQVIDVKVGHMELLGMFHAVKAFVIDFENAYMLANPQVRDTEL